MKPLLLLDGRTVPILNILFSLSKAALFVGYAVRCLNIRNWTCAMPYPKGLCNASPEGIRLPYVLHCKKPVSYLNDNLCRFISTSMLWITAHCLAQERYLHVHKFAGLSALLKKGVLAFCA